MAKYLKIKKENINILNSNADLLIGRITASKQGEATSGDEANKVTIFDEGGTFYQLTVTGSAEVWDQSIQKAITANPGGVLTTVQVPSTAAKITAAQIERFM